MSVVAASPAADAVWHGAPIIGFCGRAGAGKTTAADYLCARYGFTRVRFAGPLKDMLRALGLSAEEVDGDRKETPSPLLCGKTPRQAMQWLGTEWGRNLVGPDLWLGAWAHQVDALRASAQRIVIDDVRFRNEADAITARHGLLVRILAGAGEPPPTHISEVIGFPWDAEIKNPGRKLRPFHRALDALAAAD